MPRVSSRRSDTSERDESDGLLDQEYLRLQQEYRIMDGDRKAYSEESQNIIRKQISQIKALEKENEELMKENKLAGSVGNQTKDQKNIDQLNILLTREDEMKEETLRVTNTITDLDSKIVDMEKRIKNQRKGMGGVHMSKDKHVSTHKQIRVLENRLGQGNMKFNGGLAENAKLREDIDHMRTERTIFEGLYKKLEKLLNNNKEEIAEVIEASTSAYDARDDAQTKMMALKEKSDKDLLQYNMELKELMRVIDHDKKLKEFMTAKGEDRAEVMGLMLTSRKESDREKTGGQEDTIESYEQAFAKIAETTSISDLDLLVDKFIETEDKNFALFNYVNELNNEIEMLHEQIQEIEVSIETFNKESVELEMQRKEILADLEKRHNEADADAEGYENQVVATVKILDQLKLGAVSLFEKIDCDSSPIVEMLGGHAGITDDNMMQYLGIIEQRTNEMLQVQSFLMAKDEDKLEVAEQVGLLGKGPMPQPSITQIVPPTTGEEYDSDVSNESDDGRPMTQSELRSKIVKGLAKRDTKEQSKKSEKDRMSLLSGGGPKGEPTHTHSESRKSSKK